MADPYTRGWNEAIAAAEAIAIKWRDENRASRQRALKVGQKRAFYDGDETQLIMADQLEGAAIECNAIAQAIRALSTREKGGTRD